MIPLQLKLSGFLSYRDPVEVDFTSFDLACISGHNGAGKSSLLDAFTWVLFGEARTRGEELIHAASQAADVTLTFLYEENTYRVRRILERGKSAVLEFQIQDSDRWRPLTEATTRATQARIESILRLDYDTFVNASFFLQGKADQFTQQKASERKRILSSILGLEVWETYKARAAERRRTVEAELQNLDGRLEEINTELSEESVRKERLKDLEGQLKQLEALRAAKEADLKRAEKMRNLLDSQRKQVETLASALERSRRERGLLTSRLAAREAESASQAALVKRAAEIESRYRAWEAARADLAKWESLAGQFREAEKRRQPFLEAIHAERARLQQERQLLSNQLSVISEQKLLMANLKPEIELAEKALLEAETRLARRTDIDIKLREERERLVELDGENKRLKLEMDDLKTRLDQVSAIEGAACPLCGQPLTGAHRAALLEQLRAEGKEKGDRWRANKNIMETLAAEVKDLEAQLKSLADAENERVKLTAKLSSLGERLETARQAAAAWEAGGEKRLAEVERLLNGEAFGQESRSQLSKIDSELAAMGYDLAAHEAARLAEQEGRVAEKEWLDLEKARAALEPLEREMGELRLQIENLNSEIETQEDAYAEAVAALQEVEAQVPDLEQAEQEFYDLKEQENMLNQQVGMARQMVTVLDSRRAQKKQLEAEREACALEIGRYKTLERAFGKDGVPALLIEQALPQIEEKANELLDRLSNGAMSVRFVTQAGYKDKKREDLKETLDIQISDGAGMRDYEMFSGGEAFRVNFAIRLALSEVLARRTGARLQTLVIDEGFGSQDALGRQRLVEAINTVRRDFSKILVITHLDELKDAFPNRIEVEKTPRGSSVRVI
ncbi:MAG: SMC family ATPase [Anaerolineales bacterium]